MNEEKNIKDKKSKKAYIVLITFITLIFLVITLIIFYLYTDNYYPNDEQIIPMTYGFETDNPVIFTEDENGICTCKLTKSTSNIGLIFYPGGKVNHKSYINLGLGLANHDIITFSCI